MVEGNESIKMYQGDWFTCTWLMLGSPTKMVSLHCSMCGRYVCWYPFQLCGLECSSVACVAIRSRVFSAPSGLDSVGVKENTQQELRNLPDEIPVMCDAKYAWLYQLMLCNISGVWCYPFHGWASWWRWGTAGSNRWVIFVVFIIVDETKFKSLAQFRF